jgi:hypothetical protein
LKLVRLLAIACLGAAWLLPAAAATSAATSTIECGQLSAYTAPDPLAPADGSLTIGVLPAWTIAADATLSPTVQANLATLAGTGPSCLAVDRDGSDVITSLDFAAEGGFEGPVVFNADLPGYVFAERLIVPSFISDAYPGLAVIFVNGEATGSDVASTFYVDTSTGRFTGVDLSAEFCGPAALDGTGDGTIGEATIDASLLDATDTAALDAADGDDACAEVETRATVDGLGSLIMTTDVVISLASIPSPPITSSVAAETASSSPAISPTASLFALFCLIWLLARQAAGSRTSR